MNKGTYSLKELNILNTLEVEKDAEYANLIGEHKKAHNMIQDLMDKVAMVDTEKAWYLQTIARYEYEASKMESNKFQVLSYKKNPSLLRPTQGVEYEKIGSIDGNRNASIKNWIKQFENFQDMMLKMDEILSRLSFGEDAEKFESALHEVGQALGFICQRPDREIKQGPDNLWCLNKNEFFLFECKNEVKESRTEIYKLETGQMNNSCGWFELNYPGCEVKSIMVISSKNIASGAAFNHDVEIMRKGKLNAFKSNIKSLFNEFAAYDLNTLTDELIQASLKTHKLDIINLKREYFEKPYQNR